MCVCVFSNGVSFTRWWVSLCTCVCTCVCVCLPLLIDPARVLQEDKNSKSGRSLNEDDSGERRKGMFFSWSRNRSFGKGSKKRELTDFNSSQWRSGPRRRSLASDLQVRILTTVSFFQISPTAMVAVSPRGRCRREPAWSWGRRRGPR